MVLSSSETNGMSSDRTFITAGAPALSPSRSRLVEAICLSLLERHPTSLPRGADRPRYVSRWRQVVQAYGGLRTRVMWCRELMEQTGLQLFPINETTLMMW